MSIYSTFTPRQTEKASPVSLKDGLPLVAHRLHGIHGPRLSCNSCASSGKDREGNYIKNVAGKGDGENRYYRRWSCTTNNKFSCPTRQRHLHRLGQILAGPRFFLLGRRKRPRRLSGRQSGIPPPRPTFTGGPVSRW